MYRKNGTTRSYSKGGNKMSNLIKANQINTTGKVTISKKALDEIKYLTETCNHDPSLVVQDHVEGNWDKDNPLNELTLNALCIALYRPEDITIEQTIEEQLLDYFEIQQKAQSAMQDRTEVAVKKVLNIIGMKVKGINE